RGAGRAGGSRPPPAPATGVVARGGGPGGVGRREDISGAAHGLHEARVLGVVLDRVADARDVDVDAAIEAVPVVAIAVPDARQRLAQLVARLHAPRALG